MRALGLFLMVLCYQTSFLFAQSSSYQLDAAIDLFNSGKYKIAQKILDENLKKDPEDIDSRIVRGMMSWNLSQQKKAIEIWEAGLRDGAQDYPLLMSIGEAYYKKATRQLPFIIMEEGEKPNPLREAVIAFEKASKLYPHQPEPLEYLAKIAEEESDYKLSLQYWQRLSEMYFDNEKYISKQGSCHFMLENIELAMTFFEKAMKMNPYYAPAYQGKAECLVELIELEAAEVATQQAAYYEWLPSFVRLPYHETRYLQLSELISENETASAFSDAEKIIENLLQTNSEENNLLMAVALWYGQQSPTSENRMLDALALRGEHGQWLMVKMLENTQRTPLFANLVQRMTTVRPPGTFDLLVQFLNKEHNKSFYITDALVSLGDDRAIPYLIRELNTSKRDNSIQRIRAAFALSNFKSEITIQMLRQGMENHELAIYCVASLYKLTREEVYFEQLEGFAKQGKKNNLLADFLSDIPDKKVQKVVKKLTEQ